MSELGVALDSLALGMWWSRRSAKVTLYILEDAEQFVFVCHPWERSKVPSVSALALSSASPFSEPGGGDVGGVVAFEVAWRNIMGIDYKNPLCSDGKVVFEAYSIQRRAFPSVRVGARASGRQGTLAGVCKGAKLLNWTFLETLYVLEAEENVCIFERGGFPWAAGEKGGARR